ncbi:MAG: HAD family hydrolase [Alphaproteobacteria bacterium]|nr:HAD family hydrolase [Alphaproteobacteria bacterium]MCL2505015.1 HAD family hydrolase [Alphaproteobacteria bacterium]
MAYKDFATLEDAKKLITENKIEAVILGFGGTFTSIDLMRHLAWKYIIEENSENQNPSLYHIGKSLKLKLFSEISKDIKKRFGVPLCRQSISEEYKENLKSLQKGWYTPEYAPKLDKTVKDLLLFANASNIPVYIVSNSREEEISHYLDKAGLLGNVTDIFGSDFIKRHGGPLYNQVYHIAKRINVPTNRIVCVNSSASLDKFVGNKFKNYYKPKTIRICSELDCIDEGAEAKADLTLFIENKALFKLGATPKDKQKLKNFLYPEPQEPEWLKNYTRKNVSVQRKEAQP